MNRVYELLNFKFPTNLHVVPFLTGVNFLIRLALHTLSQFFFFFFDSKETFRQLFITYPVLLWIIEAVNHRRTHTPPGQEKK